MVINFFRLETEGLFNGLADYLEKLEAQTPIIQQTEFEKVKEWAKQESIEWGQYDVAIDELRWNYEYYFPRSLRYSFIVLLFLVTEKQLSEFCRTLQKKHNLPIKPNELRGDSIERSKTYIHRLAGISSVVDWKRVEDLSVVRNCIVHTMGDINESRDRKRIHNLVSSDVGLSMGNNEFADKDTLQISAEYCSKAVRDMRTFFDQLFDAAGIGRRLMNE